MKKKKIWLPYQQAAHLLGASQGSWIIFNQEAHFIPLPFMFLFVFVIHHKSCVPLACLLRVFGLPSLTVLYWTGRDVWFFQSLRAFKMHAGWNPKPLITAKGIG